MTSRRRNTNTSWRRTNETSLSVSFETNMRHNNGMLFLHTLETLSRRSLMVSWRRITETSRRRSNETLLGVSFGTCLRRCWDGLKEVATTSSRRPLSGRDIVLIKKELQHRCFKYFSKLNCRKPVEKKGFETLKSKTLTLSLKMLQFYVHLCFY